MGDYLRWLEYLLDMQGVTGSSPVSPTISLPRTARIKKSQGVRAGMTLIELARKEGKAKVAIAARVNGAVTDLARPLPDGAKVEWVLPSDPDGGETLWH